MLAVAGGCGGGPEPTPRRLLTPGVNIAQLFDDRDAGALVAPALQRAQRDGVRVARADALWGAVEPAPGVFAWSFTDRVAGELARHGMRWWAVLAYAPAWAAVAPGALHAAPRDPADFGAFAAAFARRYGRGGVFWRSHPELPDLPVQTLEIWNEPNSRLYWQPAVDPVAYARTFAAAARAVPAGMRLAFGGLVPSPRFLADAVAAEPGLRRRIAAVSVHPYGRTTAAVLATLADYHDATARAGLAHVPLAVTEVGWATRPPGNHYLAAEGERARLITATLPAVARARCVDAVFLSSYTTAERDPAAVGDWFGIVPPAGGSTPSRAAFRALLNDPPGAGRCP